MYCPEKISLPQNVLLVGIKILKMFACLSFAMIADRLVRLINGCL